MLHTTHVRLTLLYYISLMTLHCTIRLLHISRSFVSSVSPLSFSDSSLRVHTHRYSKFTTDTTAVIDRNEEVNRERSFALRMILNSSHAVTCDNQ